MPISPAKCSESLLNIALAVATVFVTGNIVHVTDPSITVAIAQGITGFMVGGVKLFDLFEKHKETQGPDSKAVIAKISKAIQKELDSQTLQTELIQWADDRLTELLPKCFLDKAALVNTIRVEATFPEAATDLIFEALVAADVANQPVSEDGKQRVIDPKDSLFHQPEVKAFTVSVIKASLEAALENEAYFKALQPEFLVAILNDINVVGRKVDALGQQIDTEAQKAEQRHQAAMEQSKQQAEDLTKLVEKILQQSPNHGQGQAHQATGSQEAEIQQLKQTIEFLQKRAQQGNQEAKAALDALMAQNDPRQAEQYFDQVIEQTQDAVLQQAAAYRHKGSLAYLSDTQETLAAYKRATALDPANRDGWNMLGILYHRVGELNLALAAYEEVVALAIQANSKVGKATAYGNIGNVYQTKGELDKALHYQEKSLAIDKELGRKQGMAISYGNMGNVYQTQGDLDKALSYYEQSLALNKELGRKQGMAFQYGNIGVVYQTKGELDKALSYYEQSLALNIELGSKEGMASNYGNTGIVYETKGELDKALSYYQKALALNKELGRKQGMASNYGNMGNIYQIKGELDKALSYHEKALALNKELGSKQGMAISYGNIGIVYETKGELDKARECWQQAYQLFQDMGAENSEGAVSVKQYLDETAP